MVETITPVVHGGRAGRWAGSVALHMTGAVTSAVLFGAILGAAGSLLGAPWGGGGALVVALAASLYLLREAGVVSVPVPQLRRQVPQWWRTFFSVPVAAFLYGAGLGVGFLTYLSHGTLAVVAVAATASGSPLVGAAIVAPFGMARGLSVLVAAWVRTPEEGSAMVARLARSARSPALRVTHVAALLGVAAAAAALPTGDVRIAGMGAAMLGAAFAWSAGAKLARPASWRRVLAAYGLPRRVERTSRVGVPVAEAAIVGLVVLGMHRPAGVAALVLLAAFSAAILRARRRFGDAVACGCFGASEPRDYRILLLRNAVLAGVASIAAVGGADAPRVTVPGLPTAGEALPAGLAITGLAVTAWMLASFLRSLRARRTT